MKNIKKVLLTFLALSLALLSPVRVNASEANATNAKMSIFSIDAGRKYFSKDQLKQIVKKAHDTGYTHVQLLLGNDALRFVLDDMDIEANNTTYASEDVKKAITEGNNEYYQDPNGDVLTESEMDEILAYANKLNISIIPVINGPGHMDGILSAMEVLGIENPQYAYAGKKSTRTIDLNNEEALAFNNALLQKYVNYFSGKVDIFNFGCDEYANDIDSSDEGYYNGWSRLQGTGMYPKFVEYVNEISAMIKDAGMRPMCFNDGIYYGKTYNEEFGSFDQDIIISYWTAGWWEFYVAKANDLYQRGHDIVNTNDGWYWVLGNFDGTINGQSGVPYKFDDAMKNIDTKAFDEIAGDSLNTPSIGVTHAVWCDVPSASHDMENIEKLMDAFSTKHQDQLIRPADYTNVEAALKMVPSDLSEYTTASVEALQNAIAAVDYTLKATEQAKVDAMADAILAAIDGLEVNVMKPEVKPETKPETKPEVKPETQPEMKPEVDKAPQTGDTTNMVMLWAGLIAAGAFVLTRKRLMN